MKLVHRVFEKNSFLDYYESGADMGLSDDMFESFLKYQAMLGKEFRSMQRNMDWFLLMGTAVQRNPSRLKIKLISSSRINS